ncbi:hypothetical protein OF83DRAFT_1170744 [Amylostereum chailletii]|nr:hypothetical protein OF83DRAFT_1170744 [Amylostereum chailletii]
MVSPTANGLLFTPSWDTVFASDALNIPADVNIKTDLVAQCHLVASLILFLHLSLREFVCFLFETPITKIKTLAGEFMAHRAGWVFCPSRLYAAWHTRWPRSRPHLHDTIIKSCAREIALAESDRFINDPDLKIKTKECTMDYIRRVLDPGALANKYQSLVPFCWDILLVFTTSPNRYRKAKAKRSEGKGRAAAMEDDDSSGDEYTGEGQKEFVGSVGSEWRDQGFTRNATFTLIFVLSMMGFVRNGVTNMFPVIFGLFLESNGTSSRVLSTLSSAGVCVSISTIERLKSILSVDAWCFAVELMSKTLGFFTIFDNINLYL